MTYTRKDPPDVAAIDAIFAAEVAQVNARERDATEVELAMIAGQIAIARAVVAVAHQLSLARTS